MSDKKKKPPETAPHLSDLFTTGTMIELNFGEGNNLQLWLERPTTLQQDDAMNKAKAKRARLMAAFRDEKSDEHIALEDELVSKATDEVIDELIALDEENFKRQSVSEVLYGPEGSDWGEFGQDYLELLDATQSRLFEIRDFNDGLSEEDQHLAIRIDKDEEIKRLEEQQFKFQREADARKKQLIDDRRKELGRVERAKLVDDLRKARIELEGQLVWFGEYRLRMLYYSVRYPDKKVRRYFDSMDQLLSLPAWVQQQILSEYDVFDAGGEDVKKLASLLNSSDSSELLKGVEEMSMPSGPKA